MEYGKQTKLQVAVVEIRHNLEMAAQHTAYLLHRRGSSYILPLCRDSNRRDIRRAASDVAERHANVIP